MVLDYEPMCSPNLASSHAPVSDDRWWRITRRQPDHHFTVGPTMDMHMRGWMLARRAVHPEDEPLHPEYRRHVEYTHQIG